MLVTGSPTGKTCCLLAVIAALSLTIAGCGHDHVHRGGGGPAPLQITITGCDATTFAAQGVVCVDFTISGPPGTYDIVAQYVLPAATSAVTAAEISAALQTQLGVTSNIANLVIAFDGQSVPGRFCWNAGANLGFTAANGIALLLDLVADGTTASLDGDSCIVNYTGGGAASGSSGAGAGTGGLTGRANQCDQAVGSKGLVIAGGRTNSLSGLTAFDTVDRFVIDPNTLTHTRTTAGTMAQSRDDHACAFFFDATTGSVRMLVAGGTNTPGSGAASSTADIYCFTPTEVVLPTTGPMAAARRGHTATWIPSNKVIVIGGNTGGATPTGLSSIESFDPTTGTFTTLSVALGTPRTGHTATLLANGKILVAGGFDPAAPTTPLSAELVDAVALTATVVAGGPVDHLQHTATRLANGWVLIAGGQEVSNPSNVVDHSLVFMPELGAAGAFTSTTPMMGTARAFHGASLLGDGHVLITGGVTAAAGNATTSAELFLPETLSFTSVASMGTARAEHSSTAISCGAVVIVGGRADSTNYIDTIELYPFDNAVPVIAAAVTATSGTAGTMFVNVSVSDANNDGGYVIIRFRQGSGPWQLATIDQQFPSTVAGNFPTMQVTGNSAIPSFYNFRWNFAADGVASGATVTIEVLPIGAVLGSANQFSAVTP